MVRNGKKTRGRDDKDLYGETLTRSRGSLGGGAKMRLTKTVRYDGFPDVIVKNVILCRLRSMQIAKRHEYS